ncbi:MAG: hydrolase 1, exosortase A system-associated [Candidatus Accumulibacter sp. UW26]|jgi:exosortase A-associated hydrolase 1
MKCVEQALVFPCAGELLPGVIALPQEASLAPTGHHPRAGAGEGLAGCGVLIVVGGPQYRVGSHRQFLLLARRLAAAGYPAMRFDYRGMGDADGAMRSFEDVSSDICAALDAFQHVCPSLRRFVLWGLCDAASAALLYVHASHDPRLSGLALLNPWVRSEASLAKTHIKHYYGQRLLQRDFWRHLLSGRMALLDAVRGLLRSALAAGRSGSVDGPARHTFQDRMAAGWREFSGNILLILSGEDYTAKEFLEFSASSPAWAGLLDSTSVRRIEVSGADHTFSTRQWRAAVEDATLAWLDSLRATAR